MDRYCCDREIIMRILQQTVVINRQIELTSENVQTIQSVLLRVLSVLCYFVIADTVTYADHSRWKDRCIPRSGASRMLRGLDHVT